MAEEIDKRKIVAEVVLDAKQALADAETLYQKLKEIEQLISQFNESQLNTESLSYIKNTLQDIINKGYKMADVLNMGFSNVSSARKYRNVLEEISLQIDDCRNKLQLLNVSDNIDSGAIDNYSDMLSQLEEQYDKVLIKLKGSKDIQDNQDKLNKTLSSGEVGKKFAGGVNLAITSLRTLNSIFPDTVNGIGDIITQANAAKQAMAAGTSAPMAWGTAIISGIGIVADLISNEIQKTQKAEAEALQKAAEAASEYSQNSEDLSNLSEKFVSLRSKLDSANLSRQEEIETKKELSQLQDEFISKYGLEADAIDLVTGSIQKQNAAIKKLEKTEAQNLLLKSTNEYNIYKSEMESEQTYKIYEKNGALGRNYGLNDEINSELKNNPYIKFKENNGGHGSGTIQISLNVKGKNAKDEIIKIYESMYNLQQKYHNNGDTEGEEAVKNFLSQLSNANNTYFNEEYEKRLETYKECQKAEAVLNNTSNNDDDEIKSLAQINAELSSYTSNMEFLSSAYQTAVAGGELNSETLQSLSEQYPEIAKYIEETGDATLNNGKLLEDAYNSEQSAAKKAIHTEMGKLNILIANGEATDKQKEEYYELRDMISLYTGDMLSLQDTVDIYTGKMSDLASAYKTVSEGGELNSNTLKSLCEQYPDLANYISETGDLTLKNGEKIKEAYENEKKLLIEKLTKKKKELELEKEDSANKKKVAKDLAQVNAELEICNNLQLEASEQELNWSNISSEVKNLASAYQTLNEGKQLDIDTMISLIDKYPEVAAAMAKEGQLGKDQAEVLKQIFEAKKKEYILTQQNIIANRQSSEEDKKAAQARLKAIENYNIDSSKQSGGNTDDSNKALANELKQLEHKKAIGQLNSQQEYNWLVRINNKYRKNADEQSDMEKRLYNAKKQMQADEEAANTKALQEAYKGIENKKSLGKMNSQQELRQLEQIRQRYKMTAEERMELEIKIYNLKKSLKDDEISSINTLADAVTEALKQKYEEQRKLEEDRINESIESWQNWEDKTVSAIQGEIDALDELAKKQDSENKRQEYENKRQQTELQLAYEKDDYNRTQLQKELARLDKEEAERLAEEQREAKKKALEGRIEAVKGQSQATQERLNKELDKLGEKYEKLTDSFSLKAQAQKFIADSTQKQIISLIKSYASDYEIAGNTIGDALYNGMKAKMDNISAYVDGVFGKIEAYQRQMANTANASADRFWASQNSAQSAKKQSSQKAVTVKQTVNFNQPIESPVETRRQLDRTNQALAKQISNGI